MAPSAILVVVRYDLEAVRRGRSIESANLQYPQAGRPRRLAAMTQGSWCSIVSTTENRSFEEMTVASLAPKTSWPGATIQSRLPL
jgi:hypothetical protein